MSDHKPDNLDDTELDALYRSVDAAQPPKHLDDAILALATKKPDAARRLRWTAPLASAAVVLLAVGVFVNQPQEIAVEVIAESLMDAGAAVDRAEAMQAMPASAPEEARQPFNFESANKLSHTAAVEADSIEKIADLAAPAPTQPVTVKPKARFRSMQSIARVATATFEQQGCLPFSLPKDAADIIEDEHGGTFRTRSAQMKVQCEAGEWIQIDISPEPQPQQ